MTDPRRAVVRQLVRQLVRRGLVLTVVALAACSSDDGAAAPETAAAGAAPSSSATLDPTGPVTKGLAPSTTVDPATVIDPAALLQQSLDAIGAGYHFTTNVAIDGLEVLVADGDRVGDGTRLTIWASGGSVAYVILPTASWVLPEGGEWEALDTAPATTDPITALRSPTAVTTVSSDGITTVVTATVPSVNLGVPGDGTADVQLTIAGTTLTEITYTTTIDGRPAVVHSVIGAVVDPSPVVAPV